MASPSRDILIVGAGVLGLSTAAVLRARGHAVTVVDPGGANASSVAAGMIAPAMESATEDCPRDRAELFRAAAALWPAFAAVHDIDLTPALAEWRGEGAQVLQDRLVALGFRADPTPGGVLAPEDWRLEPRRALERLAFQVDRIVGEVSGVEAGGAGVTLRLADGRSLRGDAAVLAVGPGSFASAPLQALAALSSIQPVRGQIGFIELALTDRTLRGPRGYVTPVGRGMAIGATMEAGRRDLAPCADTGARLLQAAEALLGSAIDPASVDWRVGVRGASPDGLPLAGRIAPDLAVALAPRRNGWLLGPLVGQVVADAIEGRAPRAQAAALDPLRFTRAG